MYVIYYNHYYIYNNNVSPVAFRPQALLKLSQVEVENDATPSSRLGVGAMDQAKKRR